MNPSELLRLVDTLHREKDIETEVVFLGIEAALLSAARKHLGASDGLAVSIDRETGQITARDGDREIDPSELGRIAAQTAKQVMIQKIREAERDAISKDYAERINTVLSGTVQRFEGPNIIVNLSRTDGFLPRSEQIFNETYHVGERLRALVLEVRAIGTRVRVVLSRSHPDFIRRLFELEVPEVAESLVEIKAIAREAGYRTKIAVHSLDPRVDCVGACVGVQGSRIRSIVDELNGEKIDIVRWNDQMDVLMANTLRPAEIDAIGLDEEKRHALVIVPEDQLSLAIGKRGQNVRLAAKLTGWDIDIKSAEQAEGKAPAEGQTAADTKGDEDESAATESGAEAPQDEGDAGESVPPGDQDESAATQSGAEAPQDEDETGESVPPGDEDESAVTEPGAEAPQDEGDTGESVPPRDEDESAATESGAEAPQDEGDTGESVSPTADV